MGISRTFIVGVDLSNLTDENVAVVTVMSYDGKKKVTNVIRGREAIKLYEQLKGNK